MFDVQIIFLIPVPYDKTDKETLISPVLIPLHSRNILHISKNQKIPIIHFTGLGFRIRAIELMKLTPYHAKFFAHELRRRCSSDRAEKLAGALVDAQLDLNPHQVDAALFALYIRHLLESNTRRVLNLATVACHHLPTFNTQCVTNWLTQRCWLKEMSLPNGVSTPQRSPLLMAVNRGSIFLFPMMKSPKI